MICMDDMNTILITVTQTCDCGRTGKDKFFPMTKKGKEQAIKAENKIWQCAKCKSRTTKEQSLTDSILDLEIKKYNLGGSQK